MSIKNYNVHILFLIAISILGNLCISVPFLKCQNPIITFLLSAVFTLCITLVMLPIINRAFKNKNILFYIISAIITALSLYGAAAALNDYIKFLGAIGANRVISILLLIVIIITLIFSKNSAFFKFCLFFGFVTTTVILVLFVISIGVFDVTNIKLMPIKPDIKYAIIEFFKSFSTGLSALALAALSGNNANIKNALSGAGIGLGACVLCLLQSLLVLGNSAVEYLHPYLAAVSVYSSGQLYIRQDGFVWFVFFSATIIKTALCLKAVWSIIKRLYKKSGNQI